MWSGRGRLRLARVPRGPFHLPALPIPLPRPLARPLVLPPAHARGLSTLVEREERALANDRSFGGFAERALERIRARRYPQAAGGGQALASLTSPSDLFWISSLQRASSTRLMKEDHTFAKAMVRTLGYRNPFELLEDLGLYSDMENPNIYTSSLDLGFSEGILRQADAMVAGFDESRFDWGSREDMTEMMVYTIDDPYTTETDDGISIEEKNGETWVHVHVADPTTFLPHDHEINVLAMARASTLYLPEMRAMMFPAILTSTLFSIEPERPTAVFTVSFRYDSRGEIVDYAFRLATVKNVQKLTYEQTDALLRNEVPEGDPLHRHGGAIRKIGELAERHRRCRFWDHGAFGINIPVPKVFVSQETGEIKVSMRYDYLSAARELVAEMMISAGRSIALYSVEHRIPVPFRSQPSSFCPPEILDRLRESSWKKEKSYADLYRVLPYMARARTTAAVAHHFTLAIPAYTKVTSPIRRYTDMLTHYQVKAHKRGERLPYPREELEKILSHVMSRETEIDEIQEAGERYWSLRYLENLMKKDPKPLEAVVLQTEDDGLAHQIALTETGLRARLRSRRRFEPGETIQVHVKSIDAKSNLFSVMHF